MLARKPIKIAIYELVLPEKGKEVVDVYLSSFVADPTLPAIVITEHSSEKILFEPCYNLDAYGVYPEYHGVFIQDQDEYAGLAHALAALGLVRLTGKIYGFGKIIVREAVLGLADDVWEEHRKNFISNPEDN